MFHQLVGTQGKCRFRVARKTSLLVEGANAASSCQDGLDPAIAALNAIKGKYMRSDLCSVIQSGRRIISYMSVSLGLMADADIKTEHLRWMGDTRFVYGFLRGGPFIRLIRIVSNLTPLSSRSYLAAALPDKYISQGLGAGQAQDERDIPIRLG